MILTQVPDTKIHVSPSQLISLTHNNEVQVRSVTELPAGCLHIDPPNDQHHPFILFHGGLMQSNHTCRSVHVCNFFSFQVAEQTS